MMKQSFEAPQSQSFDQQQAIRLTNTLQDSSRQLYYLLSGRGYHDAAPVIEKIYQTLRDLEAYIDGQVDASPKQQQSHDAQKNGNLTHTNHFNRIWSDEELERVRRLFDNHIR